MRKAFCVLTLLAIVAVASATVEVRIWLTDQTPVRGGTVEPFTGQVRFRTGFGPFTPFTTRTNVSGSYDVHRNWVSANNLGSVNTFSTTQDKFRPTQLPDVVEPGVGTGGIAPGKSVYIWAAFSGPGIGGEIVGEDENGDPIIEPRPLAPIKPGIGWEVKGRRVQGFNLKLVTTGDLALTPHWYQYENGSTSTTVDELRWAETSDMTMNTWTADPGHPGRLVSDPVTMVGLGTGTPPATGWYAGDVTERMQTWALDTALGWQYAMGQYGAGGILLGAITATGGGDAYISLGFNGIDATDPEGVMYFPGASNTGIDAHVIDEGLPDRVPPTPQATWTPEPASLLLLGLGVLALRRR